MLSFACDKQFKDPHHVFKFLPKWMKRITSSSSPTTTTSSVLFKSSINVLFKYFEGFTGALKLLTLIIIEWIATPRIVCQTEWNICIITFPLFKLRKKVVTSPQFECIAHIFPVNLIGFVSFVYWFVFRAVNTMYRIHLPKKNSFKKFHRLTRTNALTALFDEMTRC